MNSRTILYMTFTAIAGFFIIILMNVSTMLGIAPARFIALSDVRGMAVEHNKLLYTLNFEQQNNCVEIFNRAIPVTAADIESRKVNAPHIEDISRIIIYRFNAPDIEIKPVALIAKTHSAAETAAPRYNLVFSSPDWNPNGLLEESVQDQLQKLLATTYDS